MSQTQTIEKKTTYILVRGNHGQFEDGVSVTYRPGDTIELTAAQAASVTFRDVYGPRLQLPGATETVLPADPAAEAVETVAEPDLSQTVAEPESVPVPEPKLNALAEVHWKRAIRMIKDAETVADVQKLLDAENAEDGRKRRAVVDAALARLVELQS